jgi:hypothetical protein
MAYYTRQAARSGAKVELVELPTATPRVIKKKAQPKAQRKAPGKSLAEMQPRKPFARMGVRKWKKESPAKVRLDCAWLGNKQAADSILIACGPQDGVKGEESMNSDGIKPDLPRRTEGD